MGLRSEISQRHRNFLLNVFTDHLNVVFQLSRDWNDRGPLSHSALNESEDLKALTKWLGLIS